MIVIGRFYTFARSGLVLFAFLHCWTLAAATNLVSNLRDDLNPGSLRYAIGQAAAGDTVLFSEALAGTITLLRGELLVNKNVTILGPGASLLTITANQKHRVMVVTNSSVVLFGLTIADGRAAGADGFSSQVSATSAEDAMGGGILALNTSADYTLTIRDCMLMRNEAVGGRGGSLEWGTPGKAGSAFGGALLLNSRVILENCTFSENKAVGGEGGGAVTMGQPGGAAVGGAICNIGILEAMNCTFVSNTVTGGNGGYGGQFFGGKGGNAEGGVIYSSATLSLQSCTLSANSNRAGVGDLVAGGAFGGAMRVVSGRAEVRNSILAGNSARHATDVSGDFVSFGYNFLGSTNGSTGFGVAFDLPGNDTTKLDPHLGPLRDNGGPTWTMAPELGSPVIDAGHAFGAPRDQRGGPRTLDFPSITGPGDGSDIGAFELVAPVLSVSIEANGRMVSWPQTGTNYILESAADLKGSAWRPVTAEMQSTGAFLNHIVRGGENERYFRLRAP